jgi:hypothetical protein
MKKGQLVFEVFLFGAFLTIFLIPIVSAQPYAPNYYIERLIDWIQSSYTPIFESLLGVDAFDEFFFAKIIVFILIFSVVFMILQNNIDIFRNNRFISFVVALGVSILSIRFITDNEFFLGILLPYGVMGAAITTLLPMLIFFFFVHTSVPGDVGRRFAWFFYGVIFLVLWGMRQADIGPANWIYIAGVIFVLINFIFDGPIHEYFGTAGVAKKLKAYHVNEKANTLRKLQELDENREFYSGAEYASEKKRLENKLKFHARNA